MCECVCVCVSSMHPCPEVVVPQRVWHASIKSVQGRDCSCLQITCPPYVEMAAHEKARLIYPDASGALHLHFTFGTCK